MIHKVYILDDILTETQARFPHIRIRSFKTLYDGWRQQGRRHGRASATFTVMWNRGWLSPKDADDLRKYIGLR